MTRRCERDVANEPISLRPSAGVVADIHYSVDSSPDAATQLHANVKIIGSASENYNIELMKGKSILHTMYIRHHLLEQLSVQFGGLLNVLATAPAAFGVIFAFYRDVVASLIRLFKFFSTGRGETEGFHDVKQSRKEHGAN
jgi:hypothetical protein